MCFVQNQLLCHTYYPQIDKMPAAMMKRKLIFLHRQVKKSTVCRYYQSKSDVADQIINCVSKLENDVDKGIICHHKSLTCFNTKITKFKKSCLLLAYS